MAFKGSAARAKEKVVLPKIGEYQLVTPFCSVESGFARWAFAQRDGRDGEECFIKEFLSPVCPRPPCEIPAEMIARKRKTCEKFYQKKRKVYQAVNQSATGNIVKIDGFFFHDTKYYIVTQKIDRVNLEMKQIAEKDLKTKLVLLKVLAYSLTSLHKHGVVHADLKPNNILIKETGGGVDTGKSLTAKLIDFDSSFLEGEREEDDDIEGDVVYLAPETWLLADGDDVKLSTKVDVFALGLLFHQYYTGELPRFGSEYAYAHEAVLDNRGLFLDTSIPATLKELIGSMLQRDPALRPTMQEVFNVLSGKKDEPVVRPEPPKEDFVWKKPTGF